MSTSSVTLDTMSNAMDALSTARSNPVARSQKEYIADGQAILASTGMPPLSDFFSYHAEDTAAQSLSAGAVSSSQLSFIREWLQQIRLLKTPVAEPPASTANHIDVLA